MRAKVDWEFGDKAYITNDPDHFEYFVTGILLRPGSVILKISHCGEEKEVYLFEVKRELTELEKIGVKED